MAERTAPAFRGRRALANQYELVADPQQMTDLPAAVRDAVAGSLFTPLLSVVREVECDKGETRRRCGAGTTAPPSRAC